MQDEYLPMHGALSDEKGNGRTGREVEAGNPVCALVRWRAAVSVLNRRIKGISNTMLASSLKELERAGLVKRVQYPEIPVRVEYFVTDDCAKLVPAFEIIGAWSREKLSGKK